MSGGLLLSIELINRRETDEVSCRIRLGSAMLVVAQPALGGGTADAIYYKRYVLTINDRQPTAEAVAVKDGRILAVGSKAEVLKTAGQDTKRIDIGGRTLLRIRGFPRPHVHHRLQATTANLLHRGRQGKGHRSLQALLTDWATNNAAAVKKVG